LHWEVKHIKTCNFKESLKVKKDLKYKFIWTFYGCSYLQKDSESPVVALLKMSDLDVLKQDGGVHSSSAKNIISCSRLTLKHFLNNEALNQSKHMLSFSTIHFNIRSLSANHDGMTMLLSELQHAFDVIGLSETKIKDSCDPTRNVTKPLNFN